MARGVLIKNKELFGRRWVDRIGILLPHNDNLVITIEGDRAVVQEYSADKQAGYTALKGVEVPDEVVQKAVALIKAQKELDKDHGDILKILRML